MGNINAQSCYTAANLYGIINWLTDSFIYTYVYVYICICVYTEKYMIYENI